MAKLLDLLIVLSATMAGSFCFKMLKFNSKCESLRETMCRDLPYNQTFFPNSLNHLSQYEAMQFFKQFHPLIRIKCYEDTKLFLCSLFFPICTKINEPILPCRTLCRKARKGCQPIMKTHGFDWPAIFRCKKFPKKSKGNLCIERKNRNERKNNKRKGSKNGKN